MKKALLSGCREYGGIRRQGMLRKVNFTRISKGELEEESNADDAMLAILKPGEERAS
jgi:hypothetical protein